MRGYDRVVVGGGIFGVHAAWLSVQAGLRVAVVDREAAPMRRASHVNQARLHMGYHYPRSLFTARTSAKWFDRFVDDFPSAVNSRFEQIYAVASHNSVTTAARFTAFCRALGAPLDPVTTERLFVAGAVESAWRTREFSTDNERLSELLVGRLGNEVSWELGTPAASLRLLGDRADVTLADGKVLTAPSVVLAAYAGNNALLSSAGLDPLPVKYELCEMALVRAAGRLGATGITVMDGSFFSIMPFGNTGFHTLSSVSLTPRLTSHAALPSFTCQDHHPTCTPEALDQCTGCPVRPASAWPWMARQAARYLDPTLRFSYVRSLHAVKTVLVMSEVDDGRPTLIRRHAEEPEVISVLSGKLNSIYDLEGAL